MTFKSESKICLKPDFGISGIHQIGRLWQETYFMDVSLGAFLLFHKPSLYLNINMDEYPVQIAYFLDIWISLSLPSQLYWTFQGFVNWFSIINMCLK